MTSRVGLRPGFEQSQGATKTTDDETSRTRTRASRLLLRQDAMVILGFIPGAVLLAKWRQAKSASPLGVVEAEAYGS